MSKRKDTLQKLRDKSDDELDAWIIELRKNLQDLQMKMGFGELKEHHRIRETKKDIARALTERNQRKNHEKNI